MPDAVAGTSTANQMVTNTGLDQPSTPSNGMDKDMFLQLMVAQLKYQNPLSPMDSSEFMAQTAQFTTVEQLTELTDGLSQSLANDRMGTATGMIGRDITYGTGDGAEQTARVSSVRFSPMGPQLVLQNGMEVAMGDVVEVAAPRT